MSAHRKRRWWRASAPGVVRLSVNLSSSVAAALWQLLVDARDKGHTVLIMRGEGPEARFAEMELP